MKKHKLFLWEYMTASTKTNVRFYFQWINAVYMVHFASTLTPPLEMTGGVKVEAKRMSFTYLTILIQQVM